VKELLGHEDFSSIDAYVRLVVTDLQDALRKHHPREQEERRWQEPPPQGNVPATPP
jgi:hypothetical protein